MSENKEGLTCKVSGFCHSVIEAFTLLGCYAATSGNQLPTYAT